MPDVLLVCIMSCRSGGSRQQACRDTWLKRWRPPHLFFVGNGEDTLIGDTLVLDCPDDYATLSLKTHALCRWLLAHSTADYILKLDDDSYLHWPRFLRSGFQEHDYGGFVGVAPYTAARNLGVPYAHGGAGYWLSRRAVNIVAEHEPADMMRSTGRAGGYAIEDGAVARALADKGIRPHNTRRHRRDEWPTPANQCVTGHHLDPREMRTVHQAWCTDEPEGELCAPARCATK